jgi:hypothetical protein
VLCRSWSRKGPVRFCRTRDHAFDHGAACEMRSYARQGFLGLVATALNPWRTSWRPGRVPSSSTPDCRGGPTGAKEEGPAGPLATARFACRDSRCDDFCDGGGDDEHLLAARSRRLRRDGSDSNVPDSGADQGGDAVMREEEKEEQEEGEGGGRRRRG